MERTKLSFEMFKMDNSCIVDPNSIFINGYLPHWTMLNDFLFEKEGSYLLEMIDDMNNSKSYFVELEILEDSDDYRFWIDYNVVKVEKV